MIDKNHTDKTTHSPAVPRRSARQRLTLEEKSGILSSLFVALLVVTNLMGAKITHIGSVNFSVGLFAFPFTFLITDILTEVHGKARALQLVRNAFIALFASIIMLVFFVALPFSERSFVTTEYTAVFGASARILVASLVAYYFAQTHDVRAFTLWKHRTSGRHLWLRNNLSTIVSQFIDTAIFYTIAFLHIPGVPSVINTPAAYNFGFILNLMLPYYGLKVLVALLDTPFVYLGVRWLRGSSDGSQDESSGKIDEKISPSSVSAK